MELDHTCPGYHEHRALELGQRLLQLTLCIGVLGKGSHDGIISVSMGLLSQSQ